MTPTNTPLTYTNTVLFRSYMNSKPITQKPLHVVQEKENP